MRHERRPESHWKSILPMQAASEFAAIIAVPFVVLLVVGMLRLDERLVAPQSRAEKRAPGPHFSEVAETGEVLLTDPDGRSSSGTRRLARPES